MNKARFILLAALLLGAGASAQNVKISQLPSVSSLAGTEKIPVVQSGTTKTATPNQIVGLGSSLYQPLDSDLTSIAGLTTAATGRDLLTSVDASAVRTKAGVRIGIDVQAFGTNLSAISGLTTSANKVTYWTGLGTAALTDLTAQARTLLDDPDATTMRGTIGVGSISTQSSSSVSITGGSITGITDLAVADGGTGASTAGGARTNLGVVPGTDVQAQSANLQAISGLTTAADKVTYWTGSGTAAVTDFSSTARTLVDDTSVSAMRTTLGAAASQDVQYFTAGGTWTKPAGAKSVKVVLCGAGGGGGGGAVTASGTASSGGGGGGGGSCAERIFDATVLGSSETITVGTAGPGGASATGGTAGGNSTFGSWLTGYGGGSGTAGQSAANGGGGGGAGLLGVGGNGSGSTNGTAGLLGGAAGAVANTAYGGGGGGGQGGNGAGGAAPGSALWGGAGGGQGGGMPASPALLTGASGGRVGGHTAAALTAGLTLGQSGTSGGSITYGPGRGGGGGANQTSGNGGNGGNGESPAGGGAGGGSALTGNTGGTGGNGGAGLVVVISNF